MWKHSPVWDQDRLKELPHSSESSTKWKLTVWTFTKSKTIEHTFQSCCWAMRSLLSLNLNARDSSRWAEMQGLMHLCSLIQKVMKALRCDKIPETKETCEAAHDLSAKEVATRIRVASSSLALQKVDKVRALPRECRLKCRKGSIRKTERAQRCWLKVTSQSQKGPDSSKMILCLSMRTLREPLVAATAKLAKDRVGPIAEFPPRPWLIGAAQRKDIDYKWFNLLALKQIWLSLTGL